MKRATLSLSGQKLIGVIALAGMGLYLPSPGRAQAPHPMASVVARTGMLMGLQTIYLRAPILRYYTDPFRAAAPIPMEDLPLANLAVGANRQLYPHLDQVRATVATDEALSAFLQDSRTGAALHQALQEATLYACLPRQGLSGFNEYNAMNSLPGSLGPNQTANGAGQAAQPGAVSGSQAPASGASGAPATSGSGAAPGANSGTTTGAGAKQSGLVGDVQQVRPQENAQNTVGATAGEVSTRVATARQAALRDFTTLVVLSPNGERANLYVFGSLPDLPNPAVPVNFTVESKQYISGDRNARGVDHASSQTLLDKQMLPSATAGARYFCFVYPLATPGAGIQSNLLISYWPDTAVAVTHGVALAHSDAVLANGTSPAARWITIPMTRLQYYQPFKDTRHTLLASVEPGDPLVDAIQGPVRPQPRQAVGGRKSPPVRVPTPPRRGAGPHKNTKKRTL